MYRVKPSPKRSTLTPLKKSRMTMARKWTKIRKYSSVDDFHSTLSTATIKLNSIVPLLSTLAELCFRMDIDMASSPKASNLGTPKSSSSFMPAFLIGNMNTPVNQAKSLQSAVGSVPASSTSLLKVSLEKYFIACGYWIGTCPYRNSVVFGPNQALSVQNSIPKSLKENLRISFIFEKVPFAYVWMAKIRQKFWMFIFHSATQRSRL